MYFRNATETNIIESIMRLNKEGGIKTAVQNDEQYEEMTHFLTQVQISKVEELRTIKQARKLVNTYGSPILMNQQCESIINLSDVQVSPETENIFALGFNCHFKLKFDRTERKVEIELLC